MLHKSFKPAKCKTALNLAKSRIKLMKNKKEVQFRQLKREVAQLLQNGQDQTARIRVEHVVREEKMMAAYEMIEIYCELIVARLPIIESQKTCPLDLKEAITSLIFAAPRCGDIPELQDVRKHFSTKYGKEFVTNAIELRPQCGVSRSLVEKLSVKAPDGPTKVKILKGIAEEHNIQWEPNWFKDEETVSSSETMNIPLAEKSTKIQMEPLDAQIADDHDDKHALDMKSSESHSQIHALANPNKLQSSSLSRHDRRTSGHGSEGLHFSQSSDTAENVSSPGRQRWNMEFKDATAAAHAAAESAELASMAARAAAELASRGNVASDSAYKPTRSSAYGRTESDKHYRNSVLKDRPDQGEPKSSSFNHRSPRKQGDQRTFKQGGSMTERTDVRSTNVDDYQSGVQQETRQHGFRNHEDSVSNPSTSKAAKHGLFESSQDYQTESAENPFHEETVELQNEPSNFHSQSIQFDDEDDVFSDSDSPSDRNDLDNSFSAFSHGVAESDDWHARTASKFDNSAEEMIFTYPGQRSKFLESDETKYLFGSSSGKSIGSDQRISGVDIDDRVSHSGIGAVFDDYSSDVDDSILDNIEESKSSSGNSSPERSSPHQDNKNFEPDLSESFRKSEIYSKLNEPLPVFDDRSESGSESEEEPKMEDTEPKFGSYYARKPDRDSGVDTVLIRRSSTERGSVESLVGIKHMEDNQSIHDDSVNEEMVQESPRSFGLSLESEGHASKLYSGTHATPEDGMELNLGSLPGGRRNKSTWLPPYTSTRGGLADVLSPSRSSRAATSEDFGGYEESTASEIQLFSGQRVNRQVSNQYNFPGDDSEVGLTPKRQNAAERQSSGSNHDNLFETRAKDPIGYFDSDHSSFDEDVPKPVAGKNPSSFGTSRRTKKDSVRSVASSHRSTISDDTEKTSGYSTRSSATEPSKHQSKTTSSSSMHTHRSSWDNKASSHSRSDTRASKSNTGFSPAVAEKPVTPVAAENATVRNDKAPSRENSGKKPSHVHPKLPDFEALTAHLTSLRTDRK